MKHSEVFEQSEYGTPQLSETAYRRFWKKEAELEDARHELYQMIREYTGVAETPEEIFLVRRFFAGLVYKGWFSATAVERMSEHVINKLVSIYKKKLQEK